jgi:hypothetical protein
MNSRWMKLGILVLSLLVCIPGLALAQSGGNGGGGNGNGGGGNSGGFSTFTMNNPQPVLVYTVWGGTVAGDNASTLVVYNNGLAVWSQSDAGSLSSGGNGGNGGTGTGNNVQVIQITNAQINDLMTQLRQAGAFRQRANNGNAQSSDTPLTTVTIFTQPGGNNGNSRGNATSLAQTFSFYETTGNGSTGASRARIGNVFTNFFNTNFSGSGSGSGGSGS